MLVLLLLLRQKASPNDNHLRLSNATLGRATQRCNILCVCGCMQGEGEATRRAASWQGFLFLRVGPQQWHMNALPRAHITSSSAALLSLPLTHTHITVSPSLLHFFHCHFHFTWSQMSSTTSSCGPGNCFSCSSRCYAFSSFNTLPPFSLSVCPSPTRIHNLHINLISLLCMSAKKLSPSPGRFLQLASWWILNEL